MYARRSRADSEGRFAEGRCDAGSLGEKRNGDRSRDRSPFERIRRRPTLPQAFTCSTIGAGGLNFSVRNGKRCNPSAIATGNSCAEGLGPKSQGRVRIRDPSEKSTLTHQRQTN